MNFSNVLRSYNANVPSNGDLRVIDQETLLPVHRSWLLLLGLADRYGDRPDSGLFIGERKEPEMGAFGSSAIYGLSGILDTLPSRQPLDDRVIFRMHSAAHITKLATVFPEDDIPICHAFLFVPWLHTNY